MKKIFLQESIYFSTSCTSLHQYGLIFGKKLSQAKYKFSSLVNAPRFEPKGWDIWFSGSAVNIYQYFIGFWSTSEAPNSYSSIYEKQLYLKFDILPKSPKIQHLLFPESILSIEIYQHAIYTSHWYGFIFGKKRHWVQMEYCYHLIWDQSSVTQIVRSDLGIFLKFCRVIECTDTMDQNRAHQTDLHQFKGTLSSLRQFLATESPLKLMKNVFNFTLKALLVLKIFKFLS